MSNLTKFYLLIVCFLYLGLSSAYSQINGDFRSKTGTGLAWNTATNWEIYDASLLPGNPWKATAQWPGQVAFASPTSNTVTIQSGSTVNTAVALTANSIPNLVVNGTLTANFNGGITATTVTVASGGTINVTSTPTLNFTTYNVTGTHSGGGNTTFNVANFNVAGTFSPTGTITFASNSTVTGSGTVTFGGALTIGNNIVVTNQTAISVTGTLNGGNANSEFINSTSASVLTYLSGNTPMSTGKLTATAVGNTVTYSATGNQNVLGTNYYHLNISASNATKTLVGNTLVDGNLVVQGVSSTNLGSLSLDIYSLVVTGTTTIKAFGRIFDGNATPTAANSNWFKGAVTIDASGNMGGGTTGMLSPTTFESTFTNNGTFYAAANANYIFKGGVVTTSSWIGNGGTSVYDFQSSLTNSGTFSSGVGTFTFGGGVTSSSGTATFAGTNTFNNTVLVSGGTASFSGANTFNNTFSVTGGGGTVGGASTFASSISVSSGATLTVSGVSTVTGAINNSGTATFSGVNDVFNGAVNALAGTLTISGASTYNNNITTSTGATLNVTGRATIAGTVTNSGTTTFSFAGTLPSTVNMFNGTINALAGTLTVSGTNSTFNNNVAVSGGATFNATAATSIIGTSLNISGTGTVTFAGVTINSNIVLDNQAAISITGVLNGGNASSEFKNSQSTSVLNYLSGTAPMVTGLLTATASGNKVNYNGNADQTVKGTTYANLGINGTLTASRTKSLNGNTVVTETLVIDGTGAFINNFQISSYNLTAGLTTISSAGKIDDNNTGGTNLFTGIVTNNGTWTSSANTSYIFENGLTNTGSFTSGSGIYTFRKNPQTITGVSAITSIAIGQASDAVTNAITLANDLTVSSKVTFVKGIITTGSNKLNATSVIIGDVSGYGATSGWVNGNMSRRYTVNGQNWTFAIGTASVYAGLDLAVSAVTTAGLVTARTDDGDAVNFGSSCLNVGKSVNRTWTISASTMVPTNTNIYTATANFVAADLDGGVNTANLSGVIYNGTTWIYTTPGTRNATNTQVTNFTTLGVLQIAEPGSTTAPGTPSVFGDNQWNVYTYNASSATNYVGYYTDPALNLITTNAFANTQTPQYASTYVGCGVAANNFFTSAKRTNFTSPGYYQIGITTTDPYALYINGTLITSGTSLTSTNVWTGQLNTIDQIEYQWTGNTLPNSSSLTLTPITPAALDPGVISGSQKLCSGQTPQSTFASTTAASSGCTFGGKLTPTVNSYQWQYSPDSLTWANITGATSVTYSVSTAINSNSYYRRSVTDDCNRTAYSNVVSVKIDNGVYGDPTVYGINSWNVYCYSNNNYNSSGYAGYYVENNLSFATTDRFTTTQSPSFASGYQGCQIPVTYYSSIYKRHGIPAASAGVYQIDISAIDDGGTLIVNGITVGTWGCCTPQTNVWTGPLDENSDIEWRWFGNGGGNRSALTFTKVTPTTLLGGTIGSDQIVCAGDNPNPFTNVASPSGGCSISYYKWQYSTTGGDPWTDIASSNSATLTYPQSIYVNTSFRRVAYDLCGNSANSAAVAVNINNTPPTPSSDFGNGTWNFYMYDDQAFGTYVGYGQQTGTTSGVNRYSFKSTDYYLSSLWPSAMSGYQGCQQISSYYSIKIKRTGFDGNYYQIDVPCWDDDVYLFIDGVQQLFSPYVAGCGTPLNAVWVGQLTASSTVEFRNVNYGGPGSIQVRFTDLGTNPPNALVPGTIAASPSKFCSSNLPIVNSATPASGGCAPVYQWQSSSDSLTGFTDVFGATSASFTGSNPLTATTYFRRKASDNCGNAPVVTSSVKLTLDNTIYGTPPTPGNGVWNAYVYSGTSYSNYNGYYTDTTVNLDTRVLYTSSGSPSTVSTYQGCQVGNTNYSVRFVRTNMKPGTYRIDIPYHDDGVALFIDNVQVYQNNVCCTAESNVWTGTITASTVVEARFFNGGGAGGLNITFTPVTPATSVTPGSIGTSQTICNGAVPAAFTEQSVGVSSCYVYYQWQKSTDNVTFTNIAGATSNTYTEAATLTQTTYYRRVAKDACNNTANSNTVIVIVNPVLAAGTIGTDQSVCSGSAAAMTSLSLASGGTGSYNYQWQSSTDNVTFTNIGSAVSTSYTSGGLTANTWFRRSVSSCGTAYSNVVAVTISPATALTSNPVNGSVCAGGNISFSVTAVGKTLTYQWQVSTSGSGGPWNNVSNIGVYSNVTTPTINITGATGAMNNYQYRCVVTSGAGCSPTPVTSAAAVLTIGKSVITTQPTNNTICAGSNTSFTVVGSGSPLSYKWQVSTNGGANYTDLTNTAPYSNVTTNTLAITNASTGLSTYRYRVIISSGCGTDTTASSTSQGKLTVNSVIAGNSVTPAASSVCSGTGTTSITSSATLSGGAGAGSYSYQWQSSADNTTFGDITASGTSVSYTTVTQSNPVYYRRVVTSGGCSNTSSSVVVNITQPVSITTAPIGASVCPNDATSFNVAATGAITGYQWQVSTNSGTSYTDLTNTAPYTNVTTPTLNISSATAGMNNYRYRVRVIGTCGNVNSPSAAAGATLNTNGTVTISAHPADVTSCSARNITLSVTSTGLNLNYKWQVNNGGGYVDILSSYGGLYTNFSTNALTINSATNAMSGYKYRVVVSSSCGTPVTSNQATITVYPAISTNTVSPVQTICSGDTPAQIVGSSPNGGGTTTPVTYAYTWQSSPDNATWVTASGTANTISYNPAALNQDIYYRRIVNAGNCNASNSSSIRITVNPPTNITMQPSNFMACQGTSTSVSIAASGGALSYQWQVSTNGGGTWANVAGVNYQNGTTTTLSVINTPASFNGYQYRCIVSGNCLPPSVISNIATLSVGTAPAFTATPPNRTVCEGVSTTYPVTATAIGAITYKWYYSASGGPNTLITDNTTYSGSTTSNLSVANIPSTLNGYVFKCEANFSGCTTLSASGGNLTVNPLPKVVTQPVNSPQICQGGNTSFTVSASPVSAVVQWQEFNGTTWSNLSTGGIYSGTNTTTLSLTNIPASLNGYLYRARVAATCTPSDISNPALLTVNPPGSWLGTVSSEWSNTSNWACGVIPTSIIDAVILSSAPHYPVIPVGSTIVSKNLSIASNSSLTMQKGSVLQVYGNWSNNGTFNPGTGKVEFKGSAATQTIDKSSGNKTERYYKLNVDKTSGSVLISNTTSVDIVAGGTVNILNGQLNLNSRYFTLKSAPSQVVNDGPYNHLVDSTARLGTVTGTLTNSSNFGIERYISALTPKPRMLSTSVTGMKAAQWADSVSIFGGDFKQLAGFPSTTSTLYKYDESLSYGTLSRGFIAITKKATVLPVGQGFRILVGYDNYATYTNPVKPAVTLKMRGVPQIGNLSFPITKTGSDPYGWNMLGNPYPCEISWNSVYSANQTKLSATVAILDPKSSGTSDYYYYNAFTNTSIDPRYSVGVEPSTYGTSPRYNGGLIASSQGFFVFKTAMGSGSVNFSESQKVVTPGMLESNFRVAESEATSQRLNLVAVTNTGYIDNSYLFFSSDAKTKAYDAQYDAYKFSNTNVTIATNTYGQDMAMNGVEAISSAEMSIPVHITTKTSGTHSLYVEGIETLNKAVSVFLDDNYLHTSTELKSDNNQYVFNFTSDTASTAKSRFVLRVSESEVVTDVIDPNLAASISVYPNPTLGKATVTIKNAPSGNYSLELIDTRGIVSLRKNIVVTRSKIETTLEELNNLLDSGLYIVRITNGEHVYLSKLVLIK